MTNALQPMFVSMSRLWRFADNDGLAVIESILRESSDYLSRAGRIIVEHGEGRSTFGCSRVYEAWISDVRHSRSVWQKPLCRGLGK